MELTQIYCAELGYILMRGWEKVIKRNAESGVEEWNGEYRFVETVFAKFLHAPDDNAMGRVIGPKGKTVKWFRSAHPYADIVALTDDVHYLHQDPKFVVSAVGPTVAIAKERLVAALADLLPLLNHKDPRNHVLATFQLFCKDQIVAGLDVEWKLENFRSTPLITGDPSCFRNPATFYVKGLNNHLSVKPEAFPVCLPGFAVGAPLPGSIATAPVPSSVAPGIPWFQQPPMLPGGFQHRPMLPGGFQHRPMLPAGFQQRPMLPGGFHQRPMLPAGFQQRPMLPIGTGSHLNVRGPSMVRPAFSSGFGGSGVRPGITQPFQADPAYNSGGGYGGGRRQSNPRFKRF